MIKDFTSILIPNALHRLGTAVMDIWHANFLWFTYCCLLEAFFLSHFLEVKCIKEMQLERSD